MPNPPNRIVTSAVEDAASRRAFDDIQKRLTALEAKQAVGVKSAGNFINLGAFLGTAAWLTIPGLTVGKVATGRPILIGFELNPAVHFSQTYAEIVPGQTTWEVVFLLIRNGTPIAVFPFTNYATVGVVDASIVVTVPITSYSFIDEPAAGNVVYTFQAIDLLGTSPNLAFRDVRMVATQL